MSAPHGSRTRRPGSRAILLLVLIALVAPAVLAQSVVQNPVRGNFEHTYMVNGRVVDEEGWPLDQVTLTVLVTGLRGASMDPVRVSTNCNGDFGAVIRLGTIAGSPRVTVKISETGNEGITPVQETQKVDTFHRRNDFILKIPERWEYSCPNVEEYWTTRMTAWGRVVNGTGEHTVNGTTLHAEPLQYWPLNLTITTHNRTWPPDSVQPTDERGDFKYSWTFDDNLTSGHVDVEVLGEQARAVIDTSSRVAFFKLNVGEEGPRNAPAPGPVVAVAVIALAGFAVAFTRRRDGP